ncbi:ATP phosphoribosyltransferase regulatory subunit [Phormidium yuhuli AB48]|uniref:ATP phosphoribosyltransferase regulatory subunit n=1 Tax=Phormidium yuhuli AB48 TaxID=2940671 RepID=A0ABY5AQ17_9CYAN|nr:ATP phosphoribosyltransferase regulatory subunit [Phormidium yuhuli]USR91307.1 ATP phosphoribosyltransferase regulatory subunit [Phormidium yuhuli AB48]
MTVHQPPAGARDLLPLDVTQKQWIERRLQDAFRRWGYHRIITSTLERLDTLMAGGAIDRRTVVQFQNNDDELLGLRPELTASIARAAVSRLSDSSFPQRLYYNANVFRRSGSSAYGRQQEFYQAGVELLGASGPVADAEVLLLLADSLNRLGVEDVQVVLGEAQLTRSLLEPFPEPSRTAIRAAIADLDYVAIATLELSPQLRDRALSLFNLRGTPDEVLQRLQAFQLPESATAALDNLTALLKILKATQPGFYEQIVLDLSLIETFNYYTGIVFEVVGHSHSDRQLLGKGGRYDDLLELYHPQRQACSGIGFSLNLEDLHHLLLGGDQLPERTPSSDWLVVPRSPEAQAAAFAFAAQLRQKEALIRVELCLDSPQEAQAVRESARRRRIAQIAWVAADGTQETELVNSSAEG